MSKPVTIIKPASDAARLSFHEIWKFRELISILAMRDIKVRYKQTALGVIWSVIQPLFLMLIFSLLFGRLAKIPSDGVPYPIFVFSGLLIWNFFSAGVSSCSNSLVGSATMISKVYFPRMAIPLASVGVSLIDFSISVLVLLALMAFYAVMPTWQFLLIPLFACGAFISILGIGLWLSAITVTYRDFRYVVPFMLQLWMYITPVIYPTSFIPAEFRWLTYLNPITGWVSGTRSAFLGTQIDWIACGCSLALSLIMLSVGLRYFSNAEQRFADVI
ncbi:ABC transporter permease [Arenicella sp. 4NH20-0111]|uniref:ABC transporter permease n=1 Tax=Arenicella sp. 4NH20-0111 TaxID=3127648 RepID=UPI00333F851D